MTEKEVVLGSANFTKSGAQWSEEAGVQINDTEKVKLKEKFEELWTSAVSDHPAVADEQM